MSEARLQDPKVRRWLPLGIILSTVSPAMLRAFHPAGQAHQNLYDGLCGLLTGIGLGILIALLIRMSRQRRAGGN
jgi:hypothetical protein